MIMLGQCTARLEPAPRRWLQRIWGYTSIHTRQKWMAVWPYLARLPESGVRLLDAGCGRGGWALELASRRPQWQVIGVDKEEECIKTAESARSRLGLDNVSFIASDFLDFRPIELFDVTLSIASAHYLVEAGKGTELFDRFHTWLKPGGLLLLLGPRKGNETPLVNWLPRFQGKTFASDELIQLCRNRRFTVEAIYGCVGLAGTLAKQLDWLASGRLRLLAPFLYPVELMFTAIDRRHPAKGLPTLMWLLLARTAP